MTGQLNTNVNGSTGTCEDVAVWLRAFSTRAEIAADHAVAARNAGDSAWRGPASEAFQSALSDPIRNCDDLAYTCGQYSNALLEFASALEKVIERMASACAKAESGGLEVDGPFILPPKPVGPAPSVPSGVYTIDEANAVYGEYERDWQAYTELVDEYNRKVDVFNACGEIVRDARLREDEAHAALRDVFGVEEETSIDGVRVGVTSAAAVLDFVASAENSRADALAHVKHFATQSATYQNLALGTLSTMTAADKAAIQAAAAKAGAGKDAYEKRAAQFERYIKDVPEETRKALAYYPGKGKLLGPQDEAGMRAAKGVLSKLPAAGAGLVVFNEGRGAVMGEQSWVKAAAKTGGILGGAGAGAYLGGAAGTALFGPVGTVVGGVGGSVVGGILGEEVVNTLMPGEDPYAQPQAEMMRAERMATRGEADLRLMPNLSTESRGPYRGGG